MKTAQLDRALDSDSEVEGSNPFGHAKETLVFSVTLRIGRFYTGCGDWTSLLKSDSFACISCFANGLFRKACR